MASRICIGAGECEHHAVQARTTTTFLEMPWILAERLEDTSAAMSALIKTERFSSLSSSTFFDGARVKLFTVERLRTRNRHEAAEKGHSTSGEFLGFFASYLSLKLSSKWASGVHGRTRFQPQYGFLAWQFWSRHDRAPRLSGGSAAGSNLSFMAFPNWLAERDQFLFRS